MEKEGAESTAKNTVKRRIFISNTLMILVTLVLFFLINMAVIKIYAESIEHEFEVSADQLLDDDGLEDMVKEWTVKKDRFILLFLADGVICILALVGVSQVFTRNLTKHIMEPLDALDEGARRVQANDLTQDILYVGDAEFEEVCTTFNNMQGHILEEQEKNRRYEQARTDMIAGISHDLRTPLTAIKGSIKAMLDGVAATPQMQEKFLNAAYRRTGEMDVLLNQLFYLSKLETGNMPLEIREINLTEFLARYVTGKQEVLNTEVVELHAILQERAYFAMIDPEQMQRILDNLVENSVKYSEKSPVYVDISLKSEGEKLQLTVSDNGSGVDEEKLPHIFEEFYRADESRNKKEGNGLGLYIVKYLIEAMKGTVRAYNANGLTIEMELPLTRQENMAQVDSEQKKVDEKGSEENRNKTERTESNG